MWYDVLPSLGIVIAALSAVPVINYAFNYGQNRHWQRRYHDRNYHEFLYYLRDRNITGSWYKKQGLEAIKLDKKATE